MDDRGYCRIEGRLKDMIIRGGENIYPREIEAVLFSHPAVADAAVVGIPDRYWGEVVAAAVITSADTDEGRAGRLLPRPARRLQGARPLAVHQRLPPDRDR